MQRKSANFHTKFTTNLVKSNIGPTFFAPNWGFWGSANQTGSFEFLLDPKRNVSVELLLPL